MFLVGPFGDPRHRLLAVHAAAHDQADDVTQVATVFRMRLHPARFFRRYWSVRRGIGVARASKISGADAPAGEACLGAGPGTRYQLIF
jgi:hypothetical protein